MTTITATGIRNGEPHTVTADVSDAEIARRKAAADARRQSRNAEISSFDFFSRFTDREKLAVQTTAQTNAQVALGLTHGTIKGTVTLNGATLGAWMDLLVSLNVITSDRKAQILAIS